MGRRIIIAFFILLPIFVFAQSKTDQIKHIRQVFQSINADTSLKKAVINYEQLAKIDKNEPALDGGEEITGYYNKDTLVKIVDWVGLSNRFVIYEYYLENSQLIFIYERQCSYVYNESKATFDYQHTTTTFEGRYYLTDASLIQKVETGKLTGNKNEVINSAKQNVLKYSKMLYKFRKRGLKAGYRFKN